MKGRRPYVAAAALLALLVVDGCESIVGIDDRKVAACAPGAARCAAGARKVCANDGQEELDAPCGAGQTCVAAGLCVACADPDGTPLAAQTAGDCKRVVCRG